MSDDFEAKNVYIYKGQENTLKINRVYSTEWLCEYEMTNYPFDTQVKNYQKYRHPVNDTLKLFLYYSTVPWYSFHLEFLKHSLNFTIPCLFTQVQQNLHSIL